MNPVVLWLADGTAFFAGLAAVAAGLLLILIRWKYRLVRPALVAAVFAGGAIAVISSAPQPVGLLTAWGSAAAAALCLAAVHPKAKALRPGRAVTVALAVALSAVLAGAEFRYRRAPAIQLPPGAKVFVVGDSLSAGVRSGERPWPAVLADLTGAAVVNLARPAATTDSARSQAAAIDFVGRPRNSERLVLVEIGGNDVLGCADPAAFRRDLGALLGEIRAKGAGLVVLFELPLPPFRDDFGRAQRELAREHGAVLIPKTVLASVLGIEGGTIDGIHLSPKGHDALARSVAGMVGRPAR
jgi:lysophospholipase L1-like esterase